LKTKLDDRTKVMLTKLLNVSVTLNTHSAFIINAHVCWMGDKNGIQIPTCKNSCNVTYLGTPHNLEMPKNSRVKQKLKEV